MFSRIADLATLTKPQVDKIPQCKRPDLALHMVISYNALLANRLVPMDEVLMERAF